MFLLYFTLKGGYVRNMFVHLNSKSPLGSCTHLSLGMNDESILIMKTITKALGGYLIENDCNDIIEEFRGEADLHCDGLMYHLRESIKNNRIKNKGSAEQLIEEEKLWNERIKK